MKKIILGLSAVLLFGLSQSAWAHFGMVIPSSSMVTDQKKAEVTVELSFSHPMDMVGMDLAKPEAILVVDADGKTADLTHTLQPTKIMDKEAWKAVYAAKRPGVYQIVMQPKPYWEPAEDCFIIHYTKAYLAAFGDEDGWDRPAGLKTEIVPLTRPFGNYSGNVFQGRVLLDGQPVPGAEVEVEYYNQGKKYQSPNDYLVTQVVRADDNGIFTYAIPWAGWWGFAALNTDKKTIEHEGQAKEVEIGAVVWLEFVQPIRMK